MISWVLYLGIGLLIGAIAGYYFGRVDDLLKRQKDEAEQKLQDSRLELVQYKQNVTQHFVKTADLINNMTSSYQAVHAHLSQGAESYCMDQSGANRLQMDEQKLALDDIETSSVEVLTDKPIADETAAPATTTAKEIDNSSFEAEAKADSAPAVAADTTDADEEIKDTSPDISEQLASKVLPTTPAATDSSDKEPETETIAKADEDFNDITIAATMVATEEELEDEGNAVKKQAPLEPEELSADATSKIAETEQNITAASRMVH